MQKTIFREILQEESQDLKKNWWFYTGMVIFMLATHADLVISNETVWVVLRVFAFAIMLACIIGKMRQWILEDKTNGYRARTSAEIKNN